MTGSLLMAIVIGIYYSYRDRNKQNLQNYFFGNKNISPVSKKLCFILFLYIYNFIFSKYRNLIYF